MEVRRIKNMRFGTKELAVVVTGWVLYQEGKGYVAFSGMRDQHGILAPYSPRGGKKGRRQRI